MRRGLVRLIIATLAAPFLGVLIGALPLLATQTAEFAQSEAAEPGTVGFLIGNAVVIALYAACFLALPAMVVIGLPAHAALSALRLRHAWHYAISGVAPGIAMASLLVFWLTDETTSVGNLLQMLALGAFTGAATAWIFWLIRRPDRDAPNPITAAP
jgi:hypothetical protein